MIRPLLIALFVLSSAQAQTRSVSLEYTFVLDDQRCVLHKDHQALRVICGDVNIHTSLEDLAKLEMVVELKSVLAEDPSYKLLGFQHGKNTQKPSITVILDNIPYLLDMQSWRLIRQLQASR